MHGSIYPGHLASNTETYTIVTEGKRSRHFTDLDEAKEAYEELGEGSAFVVKAHRTFLRTPRAAEAWRAIEAERANKSEGGGSD